MEMMSHIFQVPVYRPAVVESPVYSTMKCQSGLSFDDSRLRSTQVHALVCLDHIDYVYHTEAFKSTVSYAGHLSCFPICCS